MIGGDGTMLRAIRQHWRDRLPFYGLNTGHLGFLLNDPDGLRFWEDDLRLYQLPLLWVETVAPDGERLGGLAFNDCWVERETGQTAWVEVVVNGQVRMPRVVADGMLVATAAGSTSYARAMGATPLPFNAPLLTLAGSNVLKPEFWHPAVLTGDSVVTVRNLDPVKRPLRGFLDGTRRRLGPGDGGAGQPDRGGRAPVHPGARPGGQAGRAPVPAARMTGPTGTPRPRRSALSLEPPAAAGYGPTRARTPSETPRYVAFPFHPVRGRGAGRRG